MSSEKQQLYPVELSVTSPLPPHVHSSHVSDKKPFLKVEGEWNGVMYSKGTNGVWPAPPVLLTFDHALSPSVSGSIHGHTQHPDGEEEGKETLIPGPRQAVLSVAMMPLSESCPAGESRVRWEHCTRALLDKNVEEATEAKHAVSTRAEA